MASDDKYFWRVGFPPPLLDRHSRTKHDIVEDYVRRYVLKLMAPANIPELRLTLIDGFCGGGCYQTEEGGLTDGSPLLMMRAVHEARLYLNQTRRIPRKIDVEYIFIDHLPDTTDYLKYWINAKREESAIEHIDYKQTKVLTNNFFTELPSIINRIQQRKYGEHAIFVLDQYCYKDIPLPEIANILRSLKGAEVIMTFNIDNLTTYLADRASNRKPLENIGLDNYVPWSQLKELKATNRQGWRKVLQRHLARGIKTESGAEFMTLFFVKPHGTNTWGYWLIHLTNHYRAHEVMKTLHWEHATDFGHELEPGIFEFTYNANNDIEYTGQKTFEFGEKSRNACIDGVREYFGRKIYSLERPISVGELFKGCVSNSTASESHLLEATRQLHASKDVVLVSKDGTVIRRASKKYRLDDMIEPNKQVILIR